MKKPLLSSVMLFVSLISFSQTRPALEYYMPAGVTFDTNIPPPGSFGHEVGEWHVTHDKLYGYMKLLDGLSGRAVWEDYGRSWEGRPLGQLIITSEKNMARLDPPPIGPAYTTVPLSVA